MTIDEAIEHHEWAMLESDGQVAEEHFQYVEWLLELKRHRAAWDLSCENARETILESDALRAENAKLEEQSERLFDKTLELATENSKLRELVLVMWDVALHPQLFGDGSYLLGRMSELGIEVE